jgi:hypothetical protein
VLSATREQKDQAAPCSVLCAVSLGTLRKQFPFRSIVGRMTRSATMRRPTHFTHSRQTSHRKHLQGSLCVILVSTPGAGIHLRSREMTSHPHRSIMTVSKVQIPDFFLALVVLGASREATEQDCGESRQQTIHCFTKCLTNAHPQNFERLQLHFTKCMFDAKNANLEPRFNTCFEVSAEAEFSRASACTAPSDEDVFGVMLC